jgi:prevent-host-death family protein
MKEVAVYEAKTRLSELLAAVEQGEQVTITRRGLPVARLVAASPALRSADSQRQQVAGTIAALRAGRIKLEGPLKDLIAEGRD